MSDLYTVEVVIPIPLSQTFDYMVSKLEFENIKKGSRVIVSFGHKKLYTAIVVKKFINKQYDFNLKDIEFIVDDSPCLSTEQIDLFKWISEYYLCPIGKVYETALPKIFLVKSETIIKLSNEKNNLETSDQAKLILNDIKNSVEITLKDIIKIYGKESIKLIDELIEKNKILLSEEVFDYYKPIIKSYLKINKSVDPYNLAKTPLQKKIIDLFFLENQTEISKSRVKNILNISDSAIKSLIRSNALVEFKKNILRSQDIDKKTDKKIELSKDQKTAYKRIEKEIKKEKVILFHGVTSSGKTEIYVECIKNQLNQGKSVLFLVPEIALTTQLVNRLNSFFDKELIVYHSSVNPQTRLEIWKKIISKDDPYLILGARSAVFLPIRNNGLIIVDEEHENSYKQTQKSPYYNSRDIAVYLSKIHGCSVLLGSATPSLESFYNAKIGKYSLVNLRRRFGGFDPPKIQFLDHSSTKKLFSDKVISEIKLRIEKKEQVIIFRNRRGYSTFLQCTGCSEVENCPNCDISLTYHLNTNTLKCHYCGHNEPEKKNCSSCGLPSLNRRGVGTQLIENEIEKKFPNVTVARLDYDTTRTKKSFKSIIRGFEEKEFDILVGTQMVTKGLDFSNVSLVCVIESDFLLNYPDFRANEKYFQMIRQVSGRAGRSKSQGTVLIQTKNVNHSLNRRLQLDDDINYFDGELAQRKEFGYPPYVKLIKIKFRSRNRKILYDGSNWFANALKKNMKSKILGPEFPIVSKIKNEFLMNLLIKVKPEDKLFSIKNIISKILKKFSTYSQFRLIKTNVDVDPYN